MGCPSSDTTDHRNVIDPLADADSGTMAVSTVPESSRSRPTSGIVAPAVTQLDRRVVECHRAAEGEGHDPRQLVDDRARGREGRLELGVRDGRTRAEEDTAQHQDHDRGEPAPHQQDSPTMGARMSSTSTVCVCTY